MLRGRNAFQFPRGLGLCAGDELMDQGMGGFLPVQGGCDGDRDKSAFLSRRVVGNDLIGVCIRMCRSVCTHNTE